MVNPFLIGSSSTESRFDEQQWSNIIIKFHTHGGGLVVSVLIFYSDDLNSNPAQDLSFFMCRNVILKNTNNKRPWLAYFIKELNVHADDLVTLSPVLSTQYASSFH